QLRIVSEVARLPDALSSESKTGTRMRQLIARTPVSSRVSLMRRFGTRLIVTWSIFAVAIPVLATTSAPGPNPQSQAEAFIRALNAGDIKALLAASADPLIFRNQKWKSAEDGSGFVLGEATDQTLHGKKERTDFFQHLIGAVKVSKPEGSAT